MSGKVSRRLRKNKKLVQKSASLCLALCLGTGLVTGGDFIVSLYPHFSKPFGTTHNITSGIGGGVKFTYRPLDFLNIFAQGDYLSLSLPGVNPITLFGGGLGAGYHLSLSDRMALDFNFDVGAYNAKASKSMSGLSGGIAITFTYRLNPVISADVHASGTHYASGSSPLMTVNAAVSPGLSFNITELFNNKTKVDVQEQEFLPVFPVLYSWYENNSFGKVLVENKEDSSIQNVTVSFFQPQYMGHPKECAKFKSLKKGESQEVDIYAFFNESMLELTEKTDTKAQIIVSYSCLGMKKTQSFDVVVPVYGRNNMSWDDDRRAAVFVSSKDPAALLFAKNITSIVRDNVRNGVPVNVQYAMGLFEALDQFGLSYVIDPSSAFADNVGTSSIDFLQFPYQTLMYRGGDCDDISILVCSLFEAVGIRTAFITIPGHIFIAFDTGLNVQQALSEFTSLDEMIVDKESDEVWMPLEITLSDEGFNKAWRVGAREWNTADREGLAAMYKMDESWKTYQPVSVPGAEAYFTMPDQKIVAKLFDHSVDQWIERQIEPQIKMYQAKLAIKDDVETRNKLGILYGKYGLFVKADEQFKKARHQGYQPAVINTGNIYFSRKDYERARKWYKSVLKNDPENILALLGVARCSYELTDYAECDIAYAKVKKMDAQLASEYSYLGSFTSSKGRAFSLADRLQHTIWSQEEDKVPEKAQQLLEEQAQNNNPDQTVIKEETPSDLDLDDLFDFDSELVALVPDAEIKDEEDYEDLEDYDIASAGPDGDDNPPDPDEILTEEPEEEELDLSVFTQNFSGLASEVALAENPEEFIFEDFEEDSPVDTAEEIENTTADVIASEAKQSSTEGIANTTSDVIASEAKQSSTEGIANTTSDVIASEEPATDVIASEEPATDDTASEAKQSSTEGIANTTSDVIASEAKQSSTASSPVIPPAVIPDVAPIEVPRFTEQPSEEWAPESAYTADTIPGMKSFEEEMGEYQNDMAFLYADEVVLDTDPENDFETSEEDASKEQVANAGLPEVNPFTSYLSEEDAKIVENITNYSLEEELKAEKTYVAKLDSPVEPENDVSVASENDVSVATEND
nr:hypothetical protein [Treponema sp.]